MQCERYHSILFLIGGKRLVANVSRCCFSQIFKSHNDVRLHHKAFLFNDRFFLSNLILFDEAKTLEAETMNKRQLLILTVKEGKQTNTNIVKGTRTEKTTNMADHGHDSLVIITAIENKQNSFMSK